MHGVSDVGRAQRARQKKRVIVVVLDQQNWFVRNVRHGLLQIHAILRKKKSKIYWSENPNAEAGRYSADWYRSSMNHGRESSAIIATAPLALLREAERLRGE